MKEKEEDALDQISKLRQSENGKSKGTPDAARKSGDFLKRYHLPPKEIHHLKKEDK